MKTLDKNPRPRTGSWHKKAMALTTGLSMMVTITATPASANTITAPEHDSNFSVASTLSGLINDVEKSVSNLFNSNSSSPTGTSNANGKDVNAGVPVVVLKDLTTKLTDKLHVSEVPPNVETTFHSKLVGPFKTKPVFTANPDRTKPTPIPDGAPIAGEVDTTVKGSGSFDTNAITIKEPGYYVWVESSQADQYRSAWNSDYGTPSEITLLKESPLIGTTTSNPVIKSGEDLFDTLHASNIVMPGERKVTSTLWGPFENKPSFAAASDHTGNGTTPVPAGATKVGDVETTITGNGDFKTPALKTKGPGYYVWSEKSPVSDESQGWTSDWATPSEVSVEKWQPAVKTTTSTPLTTNGSKLSDKLEVTGVAPGRGVDVKSTLWHVDNTRPAHVPNTDRNQPTPVPAGASKVGEVNTHVDKNGEFTTPEIQVNKGSGYYVWTESINSDDEHDAWNSDWANVDETTIVKYDPKITTEVSEANVTTGTEISDTYSVTGAPTGVTTDVKHELYWMDTKPSFSANTDRSKPTPIPAGASKVAEFTTSYSQDGTYQTPKFKAEKSGFYIWVESSAPQEQINPWNSDWATESEISLVKWNPLVTTDTSIAVIGNK